MGTQNFHRLFDCFLEGLSLKLVLFNFLHISMTLSVAILFLYFTLLRHFLIIGKIFLEVLFNIFWLIAHVGISWNGW